LRSALVHLGDRLSPWRTGPPVTNSARQLESDSLPPPRSPRRCPGQLRRHPRSWQSIAAPRKRRRRARGRAHVSGGHVLPARSRVGAWSWSAHCGSRDCRSRRSQHRPPTSMTRSGVPEPAAGCRAVHVHGRRERAGAQGLRGRSGGQRARPDSPPKGAAHLDAARVGVLIHRSGGRAGRTTLWSGCTKRQDAAPTSWASSPTATR
jgi:hypothetical protein